MLFQDLPPLPSCVGGGGGVGVVGGVGWVGGCVCVGGVFHKVSASQGGPGDRLHLIAPRQTTTASIRRVWNSNVKGQDMKRKKG